MKHTPIPWIANAQMNGRILIQHHDVTIARIVSNNIGDAKYYDATFIVRACNAHDDLVAALEGAIAYIGDDSRSGRRRAANMAFMAAALAKAKGE